MWKPATWADLDDSVSLRVKIKEVRQFINRVWEVSPHTHLLASVTVKTLHFPDLATCPSIPHICDISWDRERRTAPGCLQDQTNFKEMKYSLKLRIKEQTIDKSPGKLQGIVLHELWRMKSRETTAGIFHVQIHKRRNGNLRATPPVSCVSQSQMRERVAV